jgi:hypothetical protein
MKVYSTTAIGLDGAAYSVRFLLDPAELRGLQRAGIIGAVDEVLGMQDLADALVADMEKQMHTACGGLAQ